MDKSSQKVNQTKKKLYLETMRNNISAERDNMHISQEDLADAVKATRQSIHSIENGKTEPKLRLALEISRFFSLTIEDVFKDE
jgi:putative transcriptional regulator